MQDVYDFFYEETLAGNSALEPQPSTVTAFENSARTGCIWNKPEPLHFKLRKSLNRFGPHIEIALVPLYSHRLIANRLSRRKRGPRPRERINDDALPQRQYAPDELPQERLRLQAGMRRD